MKLANTIRFTVLILLLATPTFAQSWEPQVSGTAILLDSVWFSTPQNGWAVGDQGTSIFTNDGGQNWNSVFLTVQDLGGVAFRDASVGLIVGDNGTILRTVNGGATWTPVASGTGNNLASVAFGSGGRAYVVGRDETILRSGDDGASWTVVTSGGAERYRRVTAVGMQNAWAVGDGGALRATTDGGATWAVQDPTGSDLRGVSFVSASEGWVAGQNNTLLYTQNGGATWTSRNTGIFIGQDAVFFLDSSEGWTVGDQGTIFHTLNGGLNWVQDTSNTNVGLSDVFFTGGNGWTVGDQGTILFRGTTAGVGDEGAPNALALLDLEPARPNPFNPTTSIAFTLTSEGRATLSIFDAHGRRVAQPFDRVAAAGRHEMTWNGRALDGTPQPSGVYFYQLAFAGEARVGKMVMQK